MNNDEIDALAVRASMVLYKFSEGEEDYSEWQELARSLWDAIPKMSPYTASVVHRRLEGYWNRLDAR